VFSVGGHIRDWNLLSDNILLYLSGLFRILILSERAFFLLPLVGTEKVGMWSADLSGYNVGSHLFIFHFDIFTGCGPLTLGWYSVGSHLISIC
jgi:hypothetical protein